MMKIIITIILFFVFPYCYAQSFQQVLDSGKSEFRFQFSQYEPDYTASHYLFSKAVKMDSSNAEARYFLGYVLDKINMLHGMDSVNRDLCFEVSKEFEAVNKLQPHYTGELMILDPYSKLTANWGSLAFSYLSQSKTDSAKWAFMEGKRRGGFNEGILDYNRQILKSCEKNSIVLLVGDNITFPCYYLQQIEKFREDIVLVDKNLLDTKWYSRFLKRQGRIKFGYNDADLDTLDFILWNAKEMHLSPAGNTKTMTWQLKPTYLNYILRSDRILLDILESNYVKDNFYFVSPVDSSMDLYLDNYLRFKGALYQLNVSPVDNFQTPAPYDIVNKYTSAHVTKEDIIKSREVLQSYNNLRNDNLFTIYILLLQKKNKEARNLLDDMMKRFPLDKVPFINDEEKNYFNSVKAALE